MTKNILLCCLAIIPLLAVTACSQQNIPNSTAANTSNNTQNTSAVPGGNTNNQGFSSKPVVAPPNYDQRPLKPGELPTPQTLPNGLPALKPLKGVNVDELFAKNISNPDQRFDRLENAVTDMRREFETIKPAIIRLVAVEEDIQNMVEQLEVIASQDVAPRPTAANARPIPIQPSLNAQDRTPPPQAATPKPSQITQQTSNTQSGPVVKNLRTGIHSNKVRLVLDMSRKTPYSVDLDSSENILVIELPQAGWIGTTRKSFSNKEPLLASYSVEKINNNQGVRIIIPLKQSTSILKQAVLPPGSNPNFRMYVDLSR
ncbi:MAG: hypothetical protein AB8B83_07465 [Bdellovibrionales bacterium]